MNPFKKIARIKKALLISDSKSALRMIYEYLLYKINHPDLAEQYFSKYLFRKSVTNPFNYIVTRNLAEQIWYYNDMNYKSVFLQKLVFEAFFSKYNINVIKSYAYNVNHLFFRGDDLRMINSSEDFKIFLIELKERGFWKEDHMIVKKKEDSYGGRNIYKISFKDVKDNKVLLESLYNEVIKSWYLYQDLIIQHPELNRINPSALNTIRIDSFTNKKGVPKILNTTLRIGSGKTIVDNISSGGFFAGVNMKTGVLNNGEAFNSFDKSTGEIHLFHPLNGFVFNDFEIPFYQHAKQLVLNAAKLLPSARVVGWDVGIQPNGPILIEGNYWNEIYEFELGQNGHLNNPVFQELLNELRIYYADDENNLDDLKKKYPLFV